MERAGMGMTLRRAKAVASQWVCTLFDPGVIPDSYSTVILFLAINLAIDFAQQVDVASELNPTLHIQVSETGATGKIHLHFMVLASYGCMTRVA